MERALLTNAAGIKSNTEFDVSRELSPEEFAACQELIHRNAIVLVDHPDKPNYQAMRATADGLLALRVCVVTPRASPPT